MHNAKLYFSKKCFSFPESKLSDLDFCDAQIKECDLGGAVINNSIFQQFKDSAKNIRKEFNLMDNKLENSDLSNSIFIKCNLKGVSFVNSNLSNTVFEKCNLENADFTQAEITGIRFEDSKIQNTKLDIDGFVKFGNSKGFVLSG